MMYESRAIELRIEPAIEPRFTLGDWEVRPASLEVVRAGQVTIFEKRMMQVLVALNRWRGEAVSREQLSELCWEGRIVGDDALNRIISRLRKVFADDERVAIETIPRIGYRLSVAMGEEPFPAPDLIAPRKPYRAIVAGLLFLGAGALLFSLWNRSSSWDLEAIRPLTREQGVELSPSLSPNGQWIAYSAGAGFGAPRDIFMREAGAGMAPPLRLTATSAHETFPAWSPNNRRLAFVRGQGGSPCRILVVTPPNGFEQNVAACRQEKWTELAWLDDNRIAYADRAGEGAPRRLFALEIQTGRASPLTNPPTGTSDALPSLSPDGRKLVFVRSTAPGDQQLFVLDLASGEAEPVTASGWKIGGAAWSPDSGSIIFSSNREGDFGLWIISAVSGSEPARLAPGILPFGRVSTDRDGNLAVDSSRKQVNLAELTESGEQRLLTSGPGQDWDPDVSQAGDLLFGSDRSGFNEIWKQRAGAPPQRLTDRRGGFVFSPRWSPSGSQIAFLANSRAGSELLLMSADGARLRQAVRDRGNKGSVAWNGEERLLYTAEVDGHWRLIELSLRDGSTKTVPQSGDMTVLRPAPDGRLFAARLDRTLWQVALRQGRLAVEPIGLSVSDAELWAPAANGFFVLEQQPGEFQRIVRSTAGARSELAAIPPVHRPIFTAGRSAGVVHPKLVDDQADVLGFKLVSR